MPVETRRFDSADAFLATAGSFLEAREPEHMLTLGVLGELQALGGTMEEGALLTAAVDGRVVGAGLWRPPWNLVLSEVDDERALTALAEALATDDLAGVHAAEELAEPFARAWTARSGWTWRPQMRQRSYAVDTITRPVGVAGTLRGALESDRDNDGRVDGRLRRPGDGPGVRPPGHARVRRRDAYLAHPHPVHLGGRRGAGLDVSGDRSHAAWHAHRAVYTPPEHRRRGYAGAITAAASQEQLDQGLRWCFLFTDESNPTSNQIYQAIGYRPVREVQLIRFDRP